MTARILLGQPIADQLKREVVADLEALGQKSIRPGLAVVIVGEEPASQIYVGSKVKTCAELGMYSEKHELPASTTTTQLLDLIDSLNSSERIDAILVQLPLPPQVDSRKVLERILPDKDVDGFHPVNVGRLSLNLPGLVPCTPAGIIELLNRNEIEIAGRRAVVVGRSDIVGKPMSMLLLHRDATVTICHSRTRDLAAVTREADLLVAAIGRPALLTREFVKPGAVVIDVGMNRIDTRADVEKYFGDDEKRMATFEKRGYTLVGDVHPHVIEVAGALTPVPLGVGPLTIAMLMKNTVRAATLRRRPERERG